MEGWADTASWHPRNAGCFGKLKFASGRAPIMAVTKAKLSLGPNEHRLLMLLQVTFLHDIRKYSGFMRPKE